MLRIPPVALVQYCDAIIRDAGHREHVSQKLRHLEFAAGQDAKPGTRGSTYEYGIPERRQADRAEAEQAERA